MTDISVNAKSETPHAVPTASSPSISYETGSDTGQGGRATFEFPILFRGIPHDREHAMQNWQIMRAATETLARMVEDAYSIAAKESRDYGLQVMDTARLHTAAALELAQALAAAKGPSDVIALSSAHARRQMELIVEQNRQLWSVAQKIAGAMAKPDAVANQKGTERGD